MTDLSSVDNLLAHQRAELGRAEVFRFWGLTLQLLVALLAAASVFTNDGSQLLGFAGFGALVVSIWLVSDLYYRQHRASGDQARRLLLIVHGYDEIVSERDVIETGFKAPVADLGAKSIWEYFATIAPAGPCRVAEMVDESAFFTGAIQRRSGEIMLLLLFMALIIVGALGFAFAPQLDGSVRVVIARVLLAFAIFLLSSDVLGAAFAHLRSAGSMESIRYRLSSARGRHYPQGDVLQAMADYNAAVEGAPLPLPGVYRRNQEKLNRVWGEYKKRTGIGSKT
jgi:hypothetical protein